MKCSVRTYKFFYGSPFQIRGLTVGNGGGDGAEGGDGGGGGEGGDGGDGEPVPEQPLYEVREGFLLVFNPTLLALVVTPKYGIKLTEKGEKYA